VLVGFDPESGRAYGTYTHASLGAPDEAAARRAGDKFLRELTQRPGSAVKIDTIHVSLAEIKDTGAERVDPTTRKIVKAARVAP
jgi:hypothetical protein